MSTPALHSQTLGPTRFRGCVPDYTDRDQKLVYGSAAVSLDAGAMTRRMEDNIRRLSQELLAASDDGTQIQKVGELRHELQLYIQHLRARLSTFPIVQRRVRDGIPPPDIPVAANALETASRINAIETTKPEITTAPTQPDGKNDKIAS